VKKDYLAVYWEVEDGYVGGNRPQVSRIPLSEFEFCDDEAAVQDLIQTWVQEDFEQKISLCFTDLDKAVRE
jgi:hypothetical protein